MKKEIKPVYIQCPRCELNYINKKDKYCNVCKAELGLVDPAILIPDEEEEGVEKLCKVCNINYVGEDEDICFLCRKEKEEKTPDAEESDWDFSDDVLAEDDALPEEMEIPLSDLADEEEESDDDFYDEENLEPDDFDYDVDPDDYEDDEDEDEEDDDWE